MNVVGSGDLLWVRLNPKETRQKQTDKPREKDNGGEFQSGIAISRKHTMFQALMGSPRDLGDITKLIDRPDLENLFIGISSYHRFRYNRKQNSSSELQ